MIITNDNNNNNTTGGGCFSVTLASSTGASLSGAMKLNLVVKRGFNYQWRNLEGAEPAPTLDDRVTQSFKVVLANAKF